MAEAQEVLARPASKTALFAACTRLALQGFGGVLPVAQRELVERLGWLTHEQFLELLSLSQVLPGPNIVNLALIYGDRQFGWRGALAGIAGILGAPLAVVLLLALLASELRGQPMMVGALRGMGVVSAGLVMSTALKLSPGLRRSPMGLSAGVALLASTALAVGWLRWPLAQVVIGLGSLATLGVWWRLRRQEAAR